MSSETVRVRVSSWGVVHVVLGRNPRQVTLYSLSSSTTYEVKLNHPNIRTCPYFEKRLQDLRRQFPSTQYDRPEHERKDLLTFVH